MSINRRKIVFLLPSLESGGAERVCITLAHEFAKRGDCVEFLLMRKFGRLLEQTSNIFTVNSLDVRRGCQVPFMLYKYLRKNKIDAIIASMWPLTFFASTIKLYKFNKTRILIIEHSSLKSQYSGKGFLHQITLRLTLGLANRLADVSIGVSEGVAKEVASLSFLSKERVKTVYNPIPGCKFSSQVRLNQVREQWNKGQGLRLLTVGRLKEAKNHRLLITAFSRLKNRDTRLMLVGSGELEENLRSYSNDLGISERIIFAGYQTDLAAFYETADLFVLSSDREGFGNVLVEALSYGTPVVSTDCNYGPREILCDGVYGILVPVKNVDALVRAIEAALDDRVCDINKLKERAKEFLPKKIAKDYYELLFNDN